MVLETERRSGQIPKLPWDASPLDGLDGVLLNGWDSGALRRLQARRRLAKARAREARRACWDDPAPTLVAESPLALRNLGLPRWIAQALEHRIAESEKAPKKARKPQASPKR